MSSDFADNSAIKQNENIKHSKPKEKQIDELHEQILKLTNELTLIVKEATRSFTECSIKEEDTQKVADTEINNYSQITSDNLDISSSALIEEHIKREMEYDYLDNGNDAILDTDSQLREQRNEIVVKSEPLLPVVKLVPLILKTEKSLENTEPPVHQEISPVSFIGERENSICSKCNLPSDIGNHVCSFRCDLCPYSAKYSKVLGQHKWRVHKITGKKHIALWKKKLSVPGKIFKCNICPYKARTSQIIGQHKRRVHEIVGTRSAGSIEKFTVDNELALETENNAERVNQENTEKKRINQKGGKRVTRTQSSTESRGKEYKCNSCPYGTVSKDALRVHKWRKHDSHNNAGNITSSSSKVVMKCDLCSYKARYMPLLNWHKLQEHKVSGKTIKEKIENSPDKTAAPEEFIDVRNQNHPDSKDGQPSCSENEPTEEMLNRDDSRTMEYKCTFCSYTSTSKDGFRLHSWRKHSVRLKPSSDGLTLITAKTNEKKRPTNYSKKNIEFKKRFNNIRRYIKFSSNSSATTSSVTSSAEKGNLSEDQFSASHGTTPGFVHDIYHSNTEKSHVENVFEHQVLKRGSIDIMEDVNLNSGRETSAEDLIPEPEIVNTETLDEDSWIDIEEEGIEMCPKCNLSYDSNNHACLFKCDICSFTSKYRKVIVKHKLRQHKVVGKPKNQSVTGKLFKCDLCSYTSNYIQSIGKHKRKIHNVLGQASEKFLMKKKCILGSKKGKLFKCEYCTYTAKYIQNIGVHKKRMHKPEDKPIKELATNTSPNETLEPAGEIVNRSYRKKSKDAFKLHQQRKLNIKRKIKSLTDSADTAASNLNEKTPSHASKVEKVVPMKIVNAFPKYNELSNETSSEVSESEHTIPQLNTEGDVPLEIAKKRSLNKSRKLKKKTKTGETQSQTDPETSELKCKSCPYQTNIIGALRMHRWLKHKDDRKIRKTIDQAVKEHGARRLKIGSQERFICRCKKMYKNKTSLYQHIRYCMQEPRQCCYMCNYKSHRRTDVIRHLRQVHKL